MASMDELTEVVTVLKKDVEAVGWRVLKLEQRAEATELGIRLLNGNLETNTRMTEETHSIANEFREVIKDPKEAVQNLDKLSALVADVERVWALCVRFREQTIAWCKLFIVISGAVSILLGTFTHNKWYPAFSKWVLDLFT